ncbi:hypothetical protein [Dactylosporangium sp. CA-233914]|uniref:hypothetical protein n=1 Tax=Dactylosporangium sp. CA-233914 TaxID=3239934 RepID=UPI003D8DB8B5
MLWATNKFDPWTEPHYFAKFQDDGNFVQYMPGPTSLPLWASNTEDHRGWRLVVQDDGNMVIYNHDGKAIWETNTPWRPNT